MSMCFESENHIDQSIFPESLVFVITSSSSSLSQTHKWSCKPPIAALKQPYKTSNFWWCLSKNCHFHAQTLMFAGAIIKLSVCMYFKLRRTVPSLHWASLSQNRFQMSLLTSCVSNWKSSLNNLLKYSSCSYVKLLVCTLKIDGTIMVGAPVWCRIFTMKEHIVPVHFG